MARFLILTGIILIIVAIALMIAVFSVEDVPLIQDTLVGLYCESGETSITHASRLSFSGTQNSTSVWFCDDGEGNEREITAQVGLTAAGVFVVPFLIGLFMIMYGAWTIQRNFTRKIMSSVGIDNDMQIYSMKGANLSNANLSPEQQTQAQKILQSLSNASTTAASSSTLTDRLKQLEDAREQGLISSAEYQRTRQAILDSMDDM